MSAGRWVNEHRKSILFLLTVLIASGIVASFRDARLSLSQDSLSPRPNVA